MQQPACLQLGHVIERCAQALLRWWAQDLIFNSFVRRRFGAVPTLVKGEGYKALESPTLEVQEGQHGEEGFDRVRQSLCTWMCSRENCTLHDQRERGWMGS